MADVVVAVVVGFFLTKIPDEEVLAAKCVDYYVFIFEAALFC